MNNNGDFIERNCEICGKPICVIDPERWAYKVRIGESRAQKVYYCCSWKCLRQMPEKPIKGKRTGNKEVIFELIRQGKTNKEIMRELAVTNGTIKYWRQRFVE